MRLRRTLAISARALLAQKARAVLALASVSVGVAAILLIRAAGAGAEAEVQGQIAAMGTNLLVVRPAQVQRLVARRSVRGIATTLLTDDLTAIAGLPSVAAAAPGVEGVRRVKAGNSAMIVSVIGTNAAYPVVRRFPLAAGRFVDDADERAACRVAVLGARVRETLFPAGEAVGREIRIGGVPFEVVGVLVAKGVMADGSDLDGQVLVPARTALRRVFNRTWLSTIYVSAADANASERAEREITALLRARHRAARPTAEAVDDFAVQNTVRFLSMQRRATGALGNFAGGLAALALLVGGSGILAILLMAVKERTGEIGLRLAIGARPRDVFVQFLLEASMLSLGGWALGLAAAALGLAVAVLATDWRIGVPLDGLVVSFLMVVILGLGFGAVPAGRAARLPPAVALRSE